MSHAVSDKIKVRILARSREDETRNGHRNEGMVTEEKRKKTKIILGTQSKARAGWPKRLRLVQATP